MEFLKVILKSFLEKALRFSSLVLLICSGPFLAIVMLAYKGDDQTVNMATGAKVSHWLGSFGATLADTFFQAFGMTAYVIPLVCFVWAIQHLLGRSRRLFSLRTAALLVALVGASSLCSLTCPLRGGALGEISLYYMPLDKFFVWRLFWVTSTLLAFGYLFGVRLQHVRESALKSLLFLQFCGQLLGKLALYLFDVLKDFYQSFALKKTHTPQTLPLGREPLAAQPLPQKAPESMTQIRSAPPVVSASPAAAAPMPQARPAVSSVAPTMPQKSTAALSADKGPLTPEAHMPHLDLLYAYDAQNVRPTKEELQENTNALIQVLKEFGIEGRILDVKEGPVVTLYEFEPAPGIKAARVIGLADDIARSMSAVSTRVAVIAGRNAIGIEIPNKGREVVYLREVLSSQPFKKSACHLALALGKDIGGTPVVVDLARMPHLLVAGTTGSGKSVGINTMVLSLLFRLPPEKCQLLMVDPKMLELSVYNTIPHLIAPVITDPKKAVQALKWAVHEMEKRYKMMSSIAVRNIDGYNKKIKAAAASGVPLTHKIQTGFDENGAPIMETNDLPQTPLPYLVIIVDEMADLMLVAGKEIEGAIQRLAQMARAAGIHLIMATQRPSVDVITGTIKANFPSRISFQVTSKIDSRTILGEQGAEQLLGQGDMLYMSPGERMLRVHSPFVSDEEVESVVSFLKAAYPHHTSPVNFDPEVVSLEGQGAEQGDELYKRALRIVMEEKKTSTSYLQRRLQIGYNRAARLIEELEANGVLSSPNHTGKRTLLAEVS